MHHLIAGMNCKKIGATNNAGDFLSGTFGDFFGAIDILLATRPDIETSMVLRVLTRLVDEAGQAFLEAHNLLISEELALAKSEDK